MFTAIEEKLSAPPQSEASAFGDVHIHAEGENVEVSGRVGAHSSGVHAPMTVVDSGIRASETFA